MSKHTHLIGLPFVYGVQDCYSIVRSFYMDNYGIELPNYARPNEFWKYGMDMYRDRYIKNGFDVLHCHPSEYREGDVVLMAISSTVANHAGVLLENGKILQHLWGRLSSIDQYGGLFRNTTVGVFRHRDVILERAETTTDIRSILSPKMQAKLDALREVS